VTRVAVIGNAGGGKSTLCRQLSRAHGLPLYPVDQLQWRPGWVPTPSEDFAREHARLVEKDRWIIDGWGPWEAIGERFARADTIILVGHPLPVHYWWAIKRQVRCLFRPRPDGPPGCPMLPMTWPLLTMIWTINAQARPRLLEVVNALAADKRVVHLRSPRQLRRFVSQCC